MRRALFTLLIFAALTAEADAGTQLPGGSRCPVFPATNAWNRPVDGLPVAPGSNALVAAIGADAPLHPDFSAQGGYGIPYNVVGRRQRRTRVRFQYAGESDKGPYPIPAHPRIEEGSDRHLLIVDRDGCRLYELFDARRAGGGGGWQAGSGAIWDLRSNRLRPDGWTSADAAGLPIFPGLARYGEIAKGIGHALRVTAPRTRSAHVFPARHDAGADDPSLPPMGLRLRLKAGVSLAGFGPQARAVLTALKRYGMILADNGSPWFVGGAPSPRWNDDDLHQLGRIHGSDFEVVDTASFR